MAATTFILRKKSMSDLKFSYDYDETEDRLTLKHEQDVSDILEQNKAAANAKSSSDKWGEFERVASIPATVVMEWMNEGINVMAPTAEDQRRIKQKLNSNEYAFLRTRGGRL